MHAAPRRIMSCMVSAAYCSSNFVRLIINVEEGTVKKAVPQAAPSETSFMNSPTTPLIMEPFSQCICGDAACCAARLARGVDLPAGAFEVAADSELSSAKSSGAPMSGRALTAVGTVPISAVSTAGDAGAAASAGYALLFLFSSMLEVFLAE